MDTEPGDEEKNSKLGIMIIGFNDDFTEFYLLYRVESIGRKMKDNRRKLYYKSLECFSI